MDKYGSCSRCRRIIYFDQPPSEPSIGATEDLIVSAQAETVWGFAHHRYYDIYTNGGFGGFFEDKRGRKDFTLCKECGRHLLEWLKGEQSNG